MRKRTLFIISIGVSMAPTVLAATDLSSYRPQIGYTGELAMRDTNPRAAQCEIAEVIKEEEAAKKTAEAAPGKAGNAQGG